MKKTSFIKTTTKYFLAPLIVVFISFIFATKLPITKVECYVKDQACPAEVLDLLKSLHGSRFFLRDINHQVSSSLSDKALSLEKYERRLPGTLIIHLKNYRSTYRLQDQTGKQWRVTSQGQLLEDQTQDLEKILFTLDYQAIQTDKVPEDLHNTLTYLATGLEEQSLETKNIKIREDIILIELKNNRWAVLDHTQPTQTIKKLQAILDSLNEEPLDQPIQEIDLRFKLPVLRAEKTVK